MQTHPPSKTHGKAGSVLQGRSLLGRVCLLMSLPGNGTPLGPPERPNELPGGHPSSLRGGTKFISHACHSCGPPFLSRRGVCVCTHPRPPAQRRWPPVLGPDERWTPGAARCSPAERGASDSGRPRGSLCRCVAGLCPATRSGVLRVALRTPRGETELTDVSPHPRTPVPLRCAKGGCGRVKFL